MPALPQPPLIRADTSNFERIFCVKQFERPHLQNPSLLSVMDDPLTAHIFYGQHLKRNFLIKLHEIHRLFKTLNKRLFKKIKIRFLLYFLFISKVYNGCNNKIQLFLISISSVVQM